MRKFVSALIFLCAAVFVADARAEFMDEPEECPATGEIAAMPLERLVPIAQAPVERGESVRLRRLQAIACLGKFGAPAAAPLAALLVARNAADQTGVDARMAAETALGKIGAPAADALLHALDSARDEGATNVILGLLSQMQPKPPAVLALFQKVATNGSPSARDSAVTALVHESDGASVAAVAVLLRDPVDDVRRLALASLGTRQAELSGSLRTAVVDRVTHDPSPDVRREAALLLIGRSHAETGARAAIVRELIALLRDPKEDRQWFAAQELGWLQAKEAIPALVEMLKSRSASDRQYARRALEEMEAPEAAAAAKRVAPKSVTTNLAKMLSDDGAELLTSNAPLAVFDYGQLADPKFSKVRGAFFQYVTDDDLPAIVKLRNLTTLEITDSFKVTDKGLATIASLKKLTSLRLYKTSITDNGLRQLAGLPLQSLWVCDTAVDGSGLASLTKLPLNDLALIGTGTTDEALANLKSLPLRSLRLEKTHVTGSGLGSLPASLRELNLAGAPVDDAGIERLLAVDRPLEDLNLAATRVTAHALSLLVALPSLRRLLVIDTAMTPEDLASFQKLRPDVEL